MHQTLLFCSLVVIIYEYFIIIHVTVIQKVSFFFFSNSLVSSWTISMNDSRIKTNFRLFPMILWKAGDILNQKNLAKVARDCKIKSNHTLVLLHTYPHFKTNPPLKFRLDQWRFTKKKILSKKSKYPHNNDFISC